MSVARVIESQQMGKHTHTYTYTYIYSAAAERQWSGIRARLRRNKS